MSARGGSGAVWALRRLAAMGPAEVAERVRFEARKRRWERGLLPGPVASGYSGARWQLSPPAPAAGDRFPDVLAEARDMLAGRYRILGLDVREEPLDWHWEPRFGVQCPRTFGPSLRHKDPAVAGEARNLWEKGRQHHAARLAAAFWLTGDQAYAAASARLVESFAVENPFPVGINWASSLEASIRLVNWVWLERMLRGTGEHDALFGENGSMWEVVGTHQRYIMESRSVGSSANNHLIGEAAALFITACAWGATREHARMRESARRVIEREIEAQFFPAGLNREMAFAYHAFALEFLALCHLEGQRSSNPFSEAYDRRLAECIAAGAAWGSALKDGPRYGDSDDGRVLALDASGSRAADWLAQYARGVLGTNVPRLPHEQESLTAEVLGVPRLAAVIEGLASRCDNDAGLYLLRSGRVPEAGVSCLFDAGPLGYLSIAAHGHADALSICVEAGGAPVIVDIGTFTYHGDPVWRTYFRGTAGHNTILVDGEDQSVQGGPFLWTRKARATLLEWLPTASGGRVSATHDGYHRLRGRVEHRRTVELDGGSLCVSDRIDGRGTHALEWRLHFHPTVRVERIAEGLCLTWPGGSAAVRLDRAFDWRVVQGAEDAGWYSAHFNARSPSATLIGRRTASLPAEVSVSIDFEDLLQTVTAAPR